MQQPLNKRKSPDKPRQKGGAYAYHAVPWPTISKLSWEHFLKGRRFDDPGMVQRFKGERK